MVVSRVIVWREGVKFACAGVYHFIGWEDVPNFSEIVYLIGRDLEHLCDTLVAEAHFFQTEQPFLVHIFNSAELKSLFFVDNSLDFFKEEDVNACNAVNFVHSVISSNDFGKGEDSFIVRCDDSMLELV